MSASSGDLDVYVREIVPHAFDDRAEALRRALAAPLMPPFIHLTRVEVPPPGELFLHPHREPVQVRAADGFDVQQDGILRGGVVTNTLPNREPERRELSPGEASLQLYAPPSPTKHR